MKRQKVSTNEGTLDDFIDRLVSAPPQNPHSIKLEIIDEETNNDTVFNILVEIFSKTMRYLYSDRTGKVELDDLGETELTKMTNYFASFGFKLFLEKFEGSNNRDKTSFGVNEENPIKADQLKAHCLRIQSPKNLYVFFFDTLNP